MAHVKITLDMRREKANGTYNIVYRITHFKRVYTINSGFSIPSLDKIFFRPSELSFEEPNSCSRQS